MKGIIMEKSDIVALIITGFLGLILIGMSIALLLGKGKFLIAGYNTMSKEEKSKYDEIALCKFMGKILLPIGILCPSLVLADIFDMPWIIGLFTVVTLGLSIFAAIYCNTGNRFKK